MTNKLKEEFFEKFTTTYDGDYGNSPDGLSLGFSEDITPENILTFIESKLASQREEIRGKLEGKFEEINGHALLGKYASKWKNLKPDLDDALSILQEMEGVKDEIPCIRCNGNGCPACDGTNGSMYNPEPY